MRTLVLCFIRLRSVQEHVIVCFYRGDFAETFVEVDLVARLCARQGFTRSCHGDFKALQKEVSVSQSGILLTARCIVEDKFGREAVRDDVESGCVCGSVNLHVVYKAERVDVGAPV